MIFVNVSLSLLLKGEVLNRLAALVRFGATLLAADKTPVPNAVEEAEADLENDLADLHFGDPTYIDEDSQNATKPVCTTEIFCPRECAFSH